MRYLLKGRSDDDLMTLIYVDAESRREAISKGLNQGLADVWTVKEAN